MGLFSWLYEDDAKANNGKTAAELDAEGRALTRKKRQEEAAWQLYAESEGIDATGRYTLTDVVAQSDANYAAQEAQDANIGQQLDDEGKAGWDAAVAERGRQASGLINEAAKTVGGIIPWQVYVIGLAVVAFLIFQNTGGLARLIGRK